jgi:hypothetical protein
MNINDLTKEDLEFIIDNFNTIRQLYDVKYTVNVGGVYFKHESNKLYEYESLCVAVVLEIEDSMVHFSEFSISGDSFHMYDIYKSEIEFLEEFTKVDRKLESELLKLYNNKTEDINNIEKRYFNKAKDILHEYKLI